MVNLLNDDVFQIKEIDIKTTSEFICKYHYSHKMPSSIRLMLGLYHNEDLMACIIYGNPVGRNVVKFLNRPRINCAELQRLFSRDGLPKNNESYFISHSFKYLKKYYPEIKYLISYADSTYGHIGIVYQATNWKYIGESKLIIDMFIVNGKNIHPKTLCNNHGTLNKNKLKQIYGDRLEIKETKPKHRYIMCLGNKKERREWYKEFDIMPYPKLKCD
jgi:adenine modification enzyme